MEPWQYLVLGTTMAVAGGLGVCAGVYIFSGSYNAGTPSRENLSKQNNSRRRYNSSQEQPTSQRNNPSNLEKDL